MSLRIEVFLWLERIGALRLKAATPIDHEKL